jgi:hypothetical protein
MTPGAWGGTSVPALSGGVSTVRQGSAEVGRKLRLTFSNITETEFLQIVSHYRGQRSGFDSFAFTTTTIPASYTPSGHQWLYAGKPRVNDDHVDVFTVECEFRSEPRVIVRAGGADLGVTASLAAWTTPVDPYFSSVSLLLHLEGANNSTTFTDSGPLGLSVARNGSTGVISTSQAALGGSSFNVNGDRLNLPTNSALTLPGDFSIEWSARHTSFSAWQAYFGDGASGDNGGGIAFRPGVAYLYGPALRFPGNGAGAGNAAALIVANKWTSFAITRSGSILRWFVDGVLTDTLTGWTTTFDLSGAKIGNNAAGEALTGFMDEIRITKGVCRYTANYTVMPFADS